MGFTKKAGTWALLLGSGGVVLSTHAALANEGQESKILEEVVVTSPRSEEPLTVRSNPKAPHQPIPAHDGAEFLKSVPGFSLIRKGGTDGDPVLRGMSGSRLNVLLDGQQIFGGCGGRMDPPTAYVFPESYDRMTVVKGPQSVLNGPGSSAGAVLFDRNIPRFTKPGLKAHGSLTLGSRNRSDQVGDARVGYQDGYIQAVGTRTDANDYKDGDGRTVHSAYTRWSTSAAVGWTPSDHSLLELSGIRSDGEAAYADRGMDGAKFTRDNVALKLVSKNLSPLVRKVDGQVYYNYVDHVMDNYSLRTPPMAMMPMGGRFSAMNPDRETTGGHLAATLAVTDHTDLTLGIDHKRDRHTSRGAMGLMSATAATDTYESARRIEDMRFDQTGLFGEVNHYVNQGDRIIGGLRVDWHAAEDGRNCVAGMTCPSMTSAVNNTKGETDRATLTSGFVRYEGQLGHNGVWYAGLGHAQRFPDYWERLEFAPDTTMAAMGQSAFLTTRPEKTTQADMGLNWHQGAWSGSVSGFAARVDDYILIRWLAPSLTRNVEATIWGGEADLAYKLSHTVTLRSALAYVHGDNDTDHKPLAQQPPLEFRIGADYDDQTYSFGALWRLAAGQDRVDIGSGNIVANGADFDESDSFSVLSLNGGWRTTRETKLTAGIDNVFDKTYAEHLSKSAAMVPGYLVPANTRINEPGRTFWVKFNVDLEADVK